MFPQESINPNMILNPNEKQVAAISKRLNEITNGMCPCIAQDKWSEDTLCQCKEMRENDYCCCGLYVVKDSNNA